MSTAGMPGTVRRGSSLRDRAGTYARARAARGGKAPRNAYTHYFIEDEGLHSRLHLQNFWSTFWPQVEAPAMAHIQAFAADGTPLGQVDRGVDRFSAIFLEVRDILAEMGAEEPEGTVAVDLEPPRGVRDEFGELPQPGAIEIKSPFWMAYYDSDENYMYVHSIEILQGETFGAPRWIRRSRRSVPIGEAWRSWRLIEVENLADLQLVVINASPTARATTAGVYPANSPEPFWTQALELEPHQLHRVRVPAEQLADWRGRVGEVPLARVGLNPLLTPNGKPYVLLRYADGPLSLHHG